MALINLFHDVAITSPGNDTSFGTVTCPANCVGLVVTVNLATGSVFKAYVSDGVASAYDEDFNGGVALTAGSTYSFALPMGKKTTDTDPRTVAVAFRVETTGLVNRLLVQAEVS
jgi:hypothetical protein